MAALFCVLFLTYFHTHTAENMTSVEVLLSIKESVPTV